VLAGVKGALPPPSLGGFATLDPGCAPRDTSAFNRWQMKYCLASAISEAQSQLDRCASGISTLLHPRVPTLFAEMARSA
jgi:hypothetical protein